MGCLPISGGCERKLTDPFVMHLNQIEGRAYVHVSCLDREIRNRPQPEALYADGALLKQLVIERKTIGWPLDYVERHVTTHFLMDFILDAVGSKTKDAPYALELEGDISFSREWLGIFARRIADTITPLVSRLDPGQRVFIREGACTVTFWLQEDEEREYWEPSKGLIIFQTCDGSSSVPGSNELPSGLDTVIRQLWSSCEKKFAEYVGDRRILLLDPHGELRTSDRLWWRKAFNRTPPPHSISEIWLAMFDAISDVEEGWIFSKVHP